MQVDAFKPMLTPPGNKHLTLKRDALLSSFAFKFNLRRYSVVDGPAVGVRAAALLVAVTPGSGPASGGTTLTLSGAG